MATKQMQFKFEAVGMNNTTGQGFAIVSGREPTITVRRDKPNKISIAVMVTHTDAFGEDPPPAATKPPINLQKGWPFKTRYDFDWDVEVDGEEISILGDPRESTKVFSARKAVKTELKADSGKKYLAIHARSVFLVKGLKLDAPWVEGEGDLIGSGDESTESEPVKFLCRLEPEKAPKKTWPKIPDGLLSEAGYFDGKNSTNLLNESIRKIETWAKNVRDFNDGALYKVIQDVTIHLDGYTSKSGYKDYNKKLAESRIDAVERLLKKSNSLGSRIDIVTSPKQQSKFEERHDYRVEIYFDKVQAEAAMKANEP